MAEEELICITLPNRQEVILDDLPEDVQEGLRLLGREQIGLVLGCPLSVRTADDIEIGDPDSGPSCSGGQISSIRAALDYLLGQRQGRDFNLEEIEPDSDPPPLDDVLALGHQTGLDIVIPGEIKMMFTALVYQLLSKYLPDLLGEAVGLRKLGGNLGGVTSKIKAKLRFWGVIEFEIDMILQYLERVLSVIESDDLEGLKDVRIVDNAITNVLARLELMSQAELPEPQTEPSEEG